MKKIISLVFIILILSLGGLFFWAKLHFTPIYDGKINLAGLRSKVDVYYDNYGIPHISAQNKSDLYKVYGYTVMQDRFFQIQMQKMIGSGRLSEWFGDKTIETDKTIRTIGIKHYTSEWYKRNKNKINPQLISDLNAWLEGVNACVKFCPRPIEMVLIKAQPEPLTIEDVLAFSGIMSFSFTKSYFGDNLITQLSSQLNPEQIKDLAGISTNLNTAAAALLGPKSMDALDPESFIPQMDGSQSWVISPNKSASGFATLANDPHIAFSNPSVWYEAHLKTDDFELYGHFVPIIPFALIGHNTEKAWSLTMSNSDELDLIIDQDNSHFTERNETILVKNASTIELKVKDTPLGPVINSLLKNEKNAIMAWHYFRDDNYTVETFYDLAYAKSVSDFYAAIKKGRAPGLNVLWADKKGNIAWKILGYFPKRTEPFWKIRNAQKSDYSSRDNMSLAVDDKTIPQMENPKAGFILSANQKPPMRYDESQIHGYWDSNERYDSLAKDLNSTNMIDLNYQKNMFSDNNFFGAADRLRRMLDAIKPDTQTKNTLSSWDSQATLENKAQAFYQIWIDETMKIVFQKNLSETELEQFCSTTNYWKFATRIIDNPKSAWWNENYSATLQTAFDRTTLFMMSKFGSAEKWEWGKLHQIEFEHPLGKVKPLNYLFNLGPYPVAGGFMVPNAYRYKLCSHSFNVTSGASTRRLIDFKEPKESLGILPTGNSGVPFSVHYRDQVPLYLRGELRPQTMTWEQITNYKNHVEFTN